jgi:general secretion pathway protein D
MRTGAAVAAALLLGGCAKDMLPLTEPSAGHLRAEPVAAAGEGIPAPVGGVPILPPPRPAPRLETYTVVVNDVPLRDLLFALARDARVNVDIHPEISGRVTLNAINQTLPQILERLADQLPIRYTVEANRVLVAPDTPVLRTYKVEYLNLERTAKSSVSLSTEVSTLGGGGTGGEGGGAGGRGGGGGGRSGSSTDVRNVSDNLFWKTLVENLKTLAAGAGGERKPEVVANPEAGVITVVATERQHRAVQDYLDRVLKNARRQVLIEATIVEVALNDAFQAGVDWTKLAKFSGFSLVSGNPGSGLLFSSAGANYDSSQRNDAQFPPGLGAGLIALGDPYFSLNYTDQKERWSGTVRLLQEFGDTKVLSSPKLMALNNQTAVLKVVENYVYFEITNQISQGTNNQGNLQATESRPVTVPVGIVMQITPQIADDRSVVLTVRPTISRVVAEVPDPVNEGNIIPQLAVRELDSVLKLNSGQIAILGGLMQDEDQRGTSGTPILSDIPLLGSLFRQRSDSSRKTELVVFLRPVVVEDPSIETDLAAYRPLLDSALQPLSVESETGVFGRKAEVKRRVEQALTQPAASGFEP